MGRIRSIHPGLSTDDEYMALSHAAARILPLLWCECDDQGMFEWKPLTLKARLLPAHNDDMGTLLAELEARRFVKRIESAGKSYGLVRNFRKFQRPKKPNATYLLPPEFRTYVFLDGVGSEPDNDESPPVPPKEEKSPQMEDGGCRRDDEGGKPPKAPRKRGADDTPEFIEFWKIYPEQVGKAAARKAHAKALTKTDNASLIAGVGQYRSTKPADRAWCHPSTWLNEERWLDRPASVAEAAAIGETWSAQLTAFKQSGAWNRDKWGPAPNEPGCRAPQVLLDKFEIAKAA